MNKLAVARSFDRAAASYDQAAHLQRRVADRLLEALPAQGGAVESVVDLGTGTGYCLPILQQTLQPKVLTALDLSPAMLRRAQLRCPEVRLVQADLENLPFAAASQDWLVSSLAVQWLTTAEHFLVEAQRVLRPGGRLLFATLGPDTLKELRWAWTQIDDHPHVNTFFKEDEWHLGAQSAGLRVLRHEQEPVTLYYHQPAQLLSELKQLGASHVEGRQGGVSPLAFRRMLGHYQRRFGSEQGCPAHWQVSYWMMQA
ncbi:MAG: malonyl-ACP O-methyltransferase BioC [Saccharospirillum sp.]|nr:malonyl-ACP O-methyltransferase BioC [Saccharospirillum sp.]